MNEEIIELQTRLAFQEESIIELSDVVARQQKLLDRMQRDLEQLQRQVRALTPQELMDKAEEPPPPHY